MQPYLESLPSYTDGTPPWTPTNRGHGITSRPLKHDPKTQSRDLKDLCIDCRPNVFIQSRKPIMHICIYTITIVIVNLFRIPAQSIPIHVSYTIREYTIPTHLIIMPL